MDVIVLAGATKPSDLTQSEGVHNKAFIQIHGQAMLSYVVSALQQVAQIEKIVLVGPALEIQTLFKPSDTLIVVAEGKTIVENLQRGLAALSSTKPCLIVTADSAFLTCLAVENFLAACQPYTAAIYYPIISRSDIEHRFPDVKRTYVKIIDGEFTGGNALLVDPVRLEQVMPQINRFFTLRKKPWRLAAVFGIDLVLKFFTKRLTIAQLEKRFATIFSVPGQAVILSDAELGTDVDKPEDLELARKYLVPSGNNGI